MTKWDPATEPSLAAAAMGKRLAREEDRRRKVHLHLPTPSEESAAELIRAKLSEGGGRAVANPGSYGFHWDPAAPPTVEEMLVTATKRIRELEQGLKVITEDRDEYQAKAAALEARAVDEWSHARSNEFVEFEIQEIPSTEPELSVFVLEHFCPDDWPNSEAFADWVMHETGLEE